MRYVSTRGRAPVLDFEGVLLAGLARDGGLYVPESWPVFSADELRALRDRPYAEIATAVMWPFVEGTIDRDAFSDLVSECYSGFDHSAAAPVVQLDHDLWMLELFHGPTLAFKDYALQLVGRLFDHFLARRGEHMTVLGATSGDTGSAAIEALRDRASLSVFILFPKGRVSEVQRRQMTTVKAANVHAIALRGTFDDCQDTVKALFADEIFRDEVRLTAVNSINWARVMAQSAYYVAAGLALGAPDRPVSFVVPTGNFGNVFAGYGAQAMGLPVERLLVASNANDILTRFFNTGVLEVGTVEPTLSPSMDIQISSNFERLLFDLYDRDGAALETAMRAFRTHGRLDPGSARLERAKTHFAASSVDDAATLETIARVHRETGHLVDPHTAVGLAAARNVTGSRSARIALACAHPAKFPDAVSRATGVTPALPPHLADLLQREERVHELEADNAAVTEFVRARLARGHAA